MVVELFDRSFCTWTRARADRALPSRRKARRTDRIALRLSSAIL